MTDKTLILITGANQGLGYYASQQLAATGNYHVLMGSRDLSKAEKAIPTLAADSSVKLDAKNLEAIQLDVTDDDSIKAAAATVENKYGRLDILLNNAGVALAQGADPSGKGPTMRELYFQHYNPNVFGAAITTDVFLPLLRKGRDKRVAFTSSGLASLTFQTTVPQYAGAYPIYRSTKTALNMLMACYATNLGKEGFVVGACDPGYCATNLNDHQGFKDPRDGAKVLVRLVEAPKDDVHGAMIDETSKEPW